MRKITGDWNGVTSTWGLELGPGLLSHVQCYDESERAVHIDQ